MSFKFAMKMIIIISLHIQPKKSCENPIPKSIFANFHVYFQCIQNSEGALTEGVTVTSYEV